MHRIRHAAALVLLPALLAIGPAATILPTPFEPSASVSLAPSVRAVGASPAQHERLAGALAAFTEIGLALPDVEVRFYADPADCNGHDGVFEPSYVPWRISICSPLGFVYEHELAHAWEHANVDEATRVAFMAARGVDVWNGADVSWSERGIEQAAFIIQQNLLPGALPAVSSEWQNRMEAFEVLTGVPSPRIPVVGSR